MNKEKGDLRTFIKMSLTIPLLVFVVSAIIKGAEWDTPFLSIIGITYLITNGFAFVWAVFAALINYFNE